MTMLRSVGICGFLLQILMITQNHLSSAQDAIVCDGDSPESNQKKLTPEVEVVTDPVELGEGPHWDDAEQALYFVCITQASIHKYVPATNTHTSAPISGSPFFIIPIEGRPHNFAVGVGRKVVQVEWSGEGEANVIRVIAEVDQDSPNNSFNDAKADPRGRLFAGTANPDHINTGFLYRIDPDGSTHKLESGIILSNGMCFDENAAAFYYNDSYDYTVRRYDYDIETGDISNPRHVFNLTEHNLSGIADGMTLDTDGNLWVANFEGSEVLHINPRTGDLIQRVPMPVYQVTSVTFGGPNFTNLYTTSGAMPVDNTPMPPPAGSTFRLSQIGARGRPDPNVRFD